MIYHRLACLLKRGLSRHRRMSAGIDPNYLFNNVLCVLASTLLSLTPLPFSPSNLAVTSASLPFLSRTAYNNGDIHTFVRSAGAF